MAQAPHMPAAFPGHASPMNACPEADIPVVQLSINAQKPPEFHLALGAACLPPDAAVPGAAPLPSRVPPDATNL